MVLRAVCAPACELIRPTLYLIWDNSYVRFQTDPLPEKGIIALELASAISAPSLDSGNHRKSWVGNEIRARMAGHSLSGSGNILKRRELKVGSLGSTPTRFRHI